MQNVCLFVVVIFSQRRDVNSEYGIGNWTVNLERECYEYNRNFKLEKKKKEWKKCN